MLLFERDVCETCLYSVAVDGVSIRVRQNFLALVYVYKVSYVLSPKVDYKIYHYFLEQKMVFKLSRLLGFT